MRHARHAATAYAAITHTAYAVVDHATNPLAAHLLHDAARYDAWARAILEGKTFESGVFSQAPLYPFVVAAVYALAGPNPAAVVALQVGLGIATVALVGRTASRAFSESAGAWAAWVTALYGVLAFYEARLLPAALVAFLAALLAERAQAADAAKRPIAWLAAGAVLGALTIGNAASLLLLPLVGAWIALDVTRPFRHRATRAALCFAAAAAVLAPVAVRNHAASGSWILVSGNGGITFWQANNPRAMGVYSTPDGFTGAAATQRAESRRIAEAETGRALSESEVSRHWSARGRAFLLDDPARTAALYGRKILFAVASTEQPLEYSPRLDANPVRWALPLPFAALIALGVAGVAPALGRRAAHPSLFTAAAAFAALIVFYVSSRYRIGAIPGLAVLAGAGAGALRQRIVGAKGAASRPALAACIVLAVSLAWFPLTQAALARRQDAMTLTDLATAQRETGRLDDAVATYLRAIALAPGYPYAHLDLGKALAGTGRVREAEAEAREAIRLAPGLAEARFDLGVILFESGRIESSAASFAEAFRLAPENADAGNNLAGSLLKLGRTAEARSVVRTMNERRLAVDPPLARAVSE